MNRDKSNIYKINYVVECMRINQNEEESIRMVKNSEEIKRNISNDFEYFIKRRKEKTKK